MSDEAYVYKKEVDWSLLQDGFAIPLEHQVVFGQIMGRFIKRGESREINLYLNGKSYKARLYNLNIDQKFKREKDILQVRYSPTSELAKALQVCFSKSYQHLKVMRELRKPGDRSRIRIPENSREYLVVYTTMDDDSYVLETIPADDMNLLRQAVDGKDEYVAETEINYDVSDPTSLMITSEKLVKIRKLNRKIGENLKQVYQYRCQICGKVIGEEYGSHIAEAHHIDYFVSSLNNDAKNLLVVCPNHHSIIHDADPVFDRQRLMYTYKNGIEQKLVLNHHL